MTTPHYNPGGPGHWQPPASAPPMNPGPYGQPPVVMVAPPTSGMAVASLVAGIFGVFGGWCLIGIPCIIAVALGHLALVKTKDGTVGGRGMAITGLTLGYLFVVPAVLAFLLGLVGVVIPAFTTSQ